MPVSFSLALEGDKRFDRYLRLLKLAERHGFYSLQLYDHLPFRPAWGLALALAPKVKRIRLGPVTIPVFLHSPHEAARELLLLSELTRGKAVLGLSRGAYHELVGGGVRRSRHDLLRFLARLHAALSSGARLRLRSFSPKPYELYVGTSGPLLASEASKISYVDAVVVDNLWNPAYAAKLLGLMRAAAREAGRDEAPQLIARPFCSLAEDVEKARALALRELSAYLPRLVGPSPMLEEGGLRREHLTEEGALLEALERNAHNFAAVGTAEDILAQTERMVRAGVGHICFGHPLGPDPEGSLLQLAKRVKAYYEEQGAG